MHLRVIESRGKEGKGRTTVRMTEVFFFRAKLSEILVALEIGSKLYLFVFFAKGEVILSAIREIREQRERKGAERIQVEQISRTC